MKNETVLTSEKPFLELGGYESHGSEIINLFQVILSIIALDIVFFYTRAREEGNGGRGYFA